MAAPPGRKVGLIAARRTGRVREVTSRKPQVTNLPFDSLPVPQAHDIEASGQIHAAIAHDAALGVSVLAWIANERDLFVTRFPTAPHARLPYRHAPVALPAEIDAFRLAIAVTVCGDGGCVIALSASPTPGALTLAATALVRVSVDLVATATAEMCFPSTPIRKCSLLPLYASGGNERALASPATSAGALYVHIYDENLRLKTRLIFKREPPAFFMSGLCPVTDASGLFLAADSMRGTAAVEIAIQALSGNALLSNDGERAREAENDVQEQVLSVRIVKGPFVEYELSQTPIRCGTSGLIAHLRERAVVFQRYDRVAGELHDVGEWSLPDPDDTMAGLAWQAPAHLLVVYLCADPASPTGRCMRVRALPVLRVTWSPAVHLLAPETFRAEARAAATLRMAAVRHVTGPAGAGDAALHHHERALWGTLPEELFEYVLDCLYKLHGNWASRLEVAASYA